MNNFLENHFNYQFLALYLIMAFCCTFIFIETYLKKKSSLKLQWFFTILYAILFLFLFGLRDFSVGIDTITYVNFFLNETLLTDFGFYYFNKLLKEIGFDGHDYLFTVSFIYLFFILLFLKISKFKNVFLIFFCFVSLFFFKSMGNNIIRTGMAMSIFLCGYILPNKYLKYLFFVIAITIHSSFVIPILAYMGSYFLRNAKFSIIVFVASTILSLVKIPIYDVLLKIPVINRLFVDKISAYSAVNVDSYNIGFRLDFFVFNLFFAIVGYYGYNYYNKKNENFFYQRTYNIYMIMSGIFFLMFNSGFSDRYGLFSWALIPILIAPFFDNFKVKNTFINKGTILLVSFILGITFYALKTN